MLILRKRSTFAAGVATLVLLALPSLASANPGTGPELVGRSGRLVVVHADRDDGSQTRRWMLVKGASHTPVRAPADVWVDPGTPVRLEGTMQNGTLVVADSLSAVTETGVSPMLANAPAMHNTAVILFGWASGPTASQLPPAATTAIAARNLVFDNPTTSLNAYYQEQTYGQLGFYGQVYGPFNLAGGPGTCSYDNNYDWAADAMAAAGLSENSAQHFVFVFPTVSACLWQGQAEVGGKLVWVNNDFSVRVLAHELGHNLGLAHAGGLTCTSGGALAPMGDSCTTDGHEYDDPFDAMGRSQAGNGVQAVRQMSMQHKLALGLLPLSAVKVVGAPGAYRVAPMETLTGTAEVLRLPKPGGGNYYVEYRYPLGYFDGQAPNITGVLIRTESPEVAIHPTNPNADTGLIDMHPGTGASGAAWSDAALSIGQVFSDPLRGITIQNLGQDAAGATLQITAPRDAVPPSSPAGLTAVASGTTAALSWSPATDDFAVDGYVVARDGVQVGTPATTAFSDAGLLPGSTVTYAVAAVDAGGNVGPAATVALAVPDTTPPSAPPKVTARLTRDGSVHLTWAAATDDGRVASYRVLRAGTGIASGNSLAFVDRAAKPGSGSTVTYSVVAFDLVGNAGPPGLAKPLRAALLRKLAASGLKLTRITLGKRALVRVKGKVSDAQARCRLRIGKAPWHACKAKPNGAFSVDLPAKGTTPVTLSLRDSLGRVKLQTLRVR